MHSTALPVLLSLLAALLLTFPSATQPHGLLYSPNGFGGPGAGSTRQYERISYFIDSLRNPVIGSNFCRGTSANTKYVPVTVPRTGGFHTITLAYSIDAMHVGPCWVEIIDPVTRKSWQIGSVAGPRGCAQFPVAQPGPQTHRRTPASAQCPNRIPRGLVTDDMCLSQWTFRLKNVDQITCSRCVMRWVWHATHISTTNPEKYENCVDIILIKKNVTTTTTQKCS
ncbi:hypothetical protein HDV05_001104 [Chytridiales sp. JEL 0842]|nr:hypothetical protein HDV05_001104 [Chytridiales sp. JEL 0842]